MESQLAISYSQMRLSVEGWSYSQLTCWPRDSQTTQAVAKTNVCFPQTDCGNPIAKNNSTQLTEHWGIDLVITWTLISTFLSLWWLKVPPQITERKMQTTTQLKTFDLQSAVPAKYAKAILAQNFYEQPSSVWFYLRPMQGEETHNWQY